jgi:hypothetical protein
MGLLDQITKLYDELKQAITTDEELNARMALFFGSADFEPGRSDDLLYRFYHLLGLIVQQNQPPKPGPALPKPERKLVEVLDTLKLPMTTKLMLGAYFPGAIEWLKEVAGEFGQVIDTTQGPYIMILNLELGYDANQVIQYLTSYTEPS